MISRRASFKPHTNDPEFYEAFEFRTTLPGPATLTVECWDHDCASTEEEARLCPALLQYLSPPILRRHV